MSVRNSKSTATWGNGGTQASAEARKRLLRDLKELHQHPLENVAAAPVDDANMFIWHANSMLAQKYTQRTQVYI
jgi:ubiquitin-protein ligase